MFSSLLRSRCAAASSLAASGLRGGRAAAAAMPPQSGGLMHFSSGVKPGPLSAFTEEERAIQDAVRRFAQDVIAPKVNEMDKNATMDPEIIRGMFEQGFMGIEIDPKYGGTGSSFTAACIMVEELARVDASVSVCADVQNTLVNNVFAFYGSEELQARVFPRLSTDTVGSFCLSEPESGSDAFALKTKAIDQGDHFVINGNKLWITNGAEAGLFIVMANANPEAGYKGITAFLCDKDTPGLSIGPKEDKLGIRASSTVPVILEDVKVPKENVIGDVGKGYKIAIEILNEGRIGIASQMLGIAQGAFDTVMPYLWERKQFGTQIGEFQGMQHQYAQAAVDIQAARNLVYDAARRKEAGMTFVKEAAMAKLYASQVAQRVSSQAIEWMGGVGFTKEYGVEKYYRDCKVGAIYEGTSNIQLQTIAKLLKKEYQ
eukprot:gb/GECG01002456.1/.p1 GENE.gb/GECG01002456.1/~~gb/GECG01002456.1/.p1  ORF type:complete len:430 (+),score=70.84 gb/GECG01002456.1/:1-1290(+)